MDEKTGIKPLGLPNKIRQLAQERGDCLSVVEIDAQGKERSMTWRQLYQAMEKTASHMYQSGIVPGDFVVISLPNCLEHVIASLAAWQLGACCIPVSYKITPAEWDSLAGLIIPKLLVSDWDLKESGCRQITKQAIIGFGREEEPLKELPFLAVSPARGMATGGSTGSPKIVVQEIAMAYSRKDLDYWTALTGQKADKSQLIAGSLCHTLYNQSLYIGLFFGQTIYLLTRFSPSVALTCIEKYRIHYAGFVPTMMERMIQAKEFETTDIGCLEAVFHSGGACPLKTKKIWLEKVGVHKIYEFYSMTEMIGYTVIRGEDWVARQGSVGRAVNCSIQIRDEDGKTLEPGTIGEIYCKPYYGLKSKYIGHSGMKVTSDGYFSVKDLGWMDEDGFLYIADRRSDMIVTGGKNVYTLEIEELLHNYPHVRDAVIIGMPDEEWGRRVHAILELDCAEGEFSIQQLVSYLHTKVSGYKIPKTYEIVNRIPRSEMGKVRRRELAEERMIKSSKI